MTTVRARAAASSASTDVEVHLDLVGGLAGDMFVAALLHAFPEHVARVDDAIAAIGSLASVRCELVDHRDAVLAGRRFVVTNTAAAASYVRAADGLLASQRRHRTAPHPHQHPHDHTHRQDRAWRDIRAGLEAAPLDDATRAHAIAIFARLAAAEATVHGIAVDDVAFHEVGAWDSIADIVAAAAVVSAVAATRWTVGPVPLGSGRVRTAHGPLPVPAPATALLLEGFATIDDGVGGERVTPTGAAILAHLCDGDAGTTTPPPRTLRRQGLGFGTRTLPGLSNCVRVLVFERQDVAPPNGRDTLAAIEFEIDDQSGEDLAIAIDRLRAEPGIVDVVQAPVFGKKGRVMMHVRVLAHPDALDAAVRACFDETTTIGLRHRIVDRVVLARETATVEVDARPLRVKRVMRPHGTTAKAEADDVAPERLHAKRAELRRRAERTALEPADPFDD